MILHKKQLVGKILAGLRKGNNTLVTAYLRGMGRSYVLAHVARELQFGAGKTAVLSLSGMKTKRDVAEALYHGTFDRRYALAEHTSAWALEGGRDKAASVEKAWQELPAWRFIVVVDDVDSLDLGALEVLATLGELANVSFLLSTCTAQKVPDRMRAFVGNLKPDVVELSVLPDKAIGELYDKSIVERNLADEKWKRVRRKVVKAARGNPGALVSAIELLEKETTTDGFSERLSVIARQGVTVVHYEDYRLLFCVFFMALAIGTHATTNSVYRLVTATLLGALALSLYRVFLNQSKTSNPWD